MNNRVSTQRAKLGDNRVSTQRAKLGDNRVFSHFLASLPLLVMVHRILTLRQPRRFASGLRTTILNHILKNHSRASKSRQITS